MISIRWTIPLVVLALASPAIAQDAGPAPDSDKCQAQTDETQKPPTTSGGETKSLSETLDDCNGVLKPPPTGDGEMAAPAPQQGETPVIKPEQLPPQQ